LLSIDNAQLGSDKQALPKMAEANQLARLVVLHCWVISRLPPLERLFSRLFGRREAAKT
jgi:hypothetical protein